MKKGGILNPAICSLLAELGHMDELLIVDAAYPLPPDGHVIDLTLTPGHPAVPRRPPRRGRGAGHRVDHRRLRDHRVQPQIYQEILKIVGDVDVDEVPHHEFKEQSLGVKGIIRTAEFSPTPTSGSWRAAR